MSGLRAIRSLPHGELVALVDRLGLPGFQVNVIKAALYRHSAGGFDEITSLPQRARESLAAEFHAGLPEVAERKTSRDGTIKFLLRWPDALAEAVLMPSSGGRTLCLSSQSGCRLKCAFCATGRMGLARNLRFGEILDQALVASGEGALTRVVFMGMGEPMENLAEVVPAIEFLKAKNGFGLSRKRITVSTVGLVPELREFADSKAGVELALSLHATTDTIRDALVPVNRRYPIAEALEAAAYYGHAANSRVTLEYILLDEINDTPEDARRLAKFSRRYEFPVNLIVYNRTGFEGLSESRHLDRFVRILAEEKAVVTVRRSKGADIAAACGQLAASSPAAA